MNSPKYFYFHFISACFISNSFSTMMIKVFSFLNFTSFKEICIKKDILEKSLFLWIVLLRFNVNCVSYTKKYRTLYKCGQKSDQNSDSF